MAGTLTTGQYRIPEITTAQRTAVTDPGSQIVYDTDLDAAFLGLSTGGWQRLVDGVVIRHISDGTPPPMRAASEVDEPAITFVSGIANPPRTPDPRGVWYAEVNARAFTHIAPSIQAIAAVVRQSSSEITTGPGDAGPTTAQVGDMHFRPAVGNTSAALFIRTAVGTSSDWTEIELNPSISFEQLSDYDSSITQVEQGDMLRYDGSLWEPFTPSSRVLVDVDDNRATAAGQFLVWNAFDPATPNTPARWVPTTVDLQDLNNVADNAPNSSDNDSVLTWDDGAGGHWRAAKVQIANASDTAINNPVNTQSLVHNGTAWVNQTLPFPAVVADNNGAVSLRQGVDAGNIRTAIGAAASGVAAPSTTLVTGTGTAPLQTVRGAAAGTLLYLTVPVTRTQPTGTWLEVPGAAAASFTANDVTMTYSGGFTPSTGLNALLTRVNSLAGVTTTPTPSSTTNRGGGATAPVFRWSGLTNLTTAGFRIGFHNGTLQWAPGPPIGTLNTREWNEVYSQPSGYIPPIGSVGNLEVATNAAVTITVPANLLLLKLTLTTYRVILGTSGDFATGATITIPNS